MRRNSTSQMQCVAVWTRKCSADPRSRLWVVGLTYLNSSEAAIGRIESVDVRAGTPAGRELGATAPALTLWRIRNWIAGVRLTVQWGLGVCRASTPGLRAPQSATGRTGRRRGLNADTALRLARYFGTTPQLWLNLQKTWELRRAEIEAGREIAEQVTPRRALV